MVVEMSEFRYVLPDRYTAEQVEALLCRHYLCPYCRSQSTTARGAEDTTWVETPLRMSGPKWICLGCCIDIYSTCLSEYFDEHPYKSLVDEVASLEKLKTSNIRDICLKHQSEIASRRLVETGDARYGEVIQRIQRLNSW
jgi:hypothetical protein